MKKTNSKSVKPTNELIILKSEEFGQVKVVSDEKAEGYFCLNDLCGILNLSKKEVIEKLLGHLYTAMLSRPAKPQSMLIEPLMISYTSSLQK